MAIELVFTSSNSIRRVHVNGKKIAILAPELSFAPLEIDLDRLKEKEMQDKIRKLKMNERDEKVLHELAKLNSEEEIIKDIKKDFQETGWRLIKKNEFI